MAPTPNAASKPIAVPPLPKEKVQMKYTSADITSNGEIKVKILTNDPAKSSSSFLAKWKESQTGRHGNTNPNIISVNPTLTSGDKESMYKV